MKPIQILTVIVLGLVTAIALKVALSPAPVTAETVIPAPISSPSKEISEEKVTKEEESKFSHLLKPSEISFVIKGAKATDKVLYLNSMADYKDPACETIRVDLTKVHMLQGVDVRKLKGRTVKAQTDKVTEYRQIDIQ